MQTDALSMACWTSRATHCTYSLGTFMTTLILLFILRHAILCLALSFLFVFSLTRSAYTLDLQIMTVLNT